MAGQFGFSGFAEALAFGRESRLEGRLESRRQRFQEQELQFDISKEQQKRIDEVAAQVRANVTLVGEARRKGLIPAENFPGLLRSTEGMIATLSKLDNTLAIQLNSSFQSALTAKPTGGILAKQAGETAVTTAETILEKPPTQFQREKLAGVEAPVVTPPASAFVDELGNLKPLVSNSTRQFVAQLFGGVLDPFGNFRLLNPEDAPKALEIAATAEALLLGGQEQSVAAAVQRAGKESGFFPDVPVVPASVATTVGEKPGAPVTKIDVPIGGGTAIVFEGKIHDVVQEFPNGDMLIKDREGGAPFRVRSK